MRTAVLVLLFAAQLAGQPGSIDGTVVDLTHSKPLAGVHVRLYIGPVPQMAKEAYGSTTDADGRYSVASIEPGTYTVELERAGFVAAPTNKSFPYGAEIVVHRGEHVANRQLAMLPLIPVSGRVVNQYGDAVPDTPVNVVPVREYSDRFLGLYNQNQTDEQGQFRLFVTPGKYHVIAGHRYGGLLGTDEIRSDGAPDLEYAPTYYPSAMDVGSATPVEVKAGGEIAGLEIHLRAVAVRRDLTVAGRVTGMPAGAMATILYWWGEAPGKFEGESRFAAEADGRFSFDDRPDGYVRLMAQCCSPENDLQSEAEDIHLQPPGATDVLLRLAPGGVVTGKLEMAGEDAAAATVDGKLKVGLSPSLGISLEALSAAVQADGAFRFTGVVPGVYTVNIEGLPDNGYVQAITLDGAASDGTLDFSLGMRASRLKITIGLNGAQISGDLRDADGGPTLSTRRSVYLTAEPGQTGPNHPDAIIDGNRYLLKGVPPGKYKLFAADYSLVTPETMPSFLAAAESIDIPVGGRVIHNLKVLEASDVDPKK